VSIPIEPWDERLTTAQAERAMIDSDMSRRRRKQRIDAVAAQLMLQSYLDAGRGKC
jgi:putative Holliday junction resolvase